MAPVTAAATWPMSCSHAQRTRRALSTKLPLGAAAPESHRPRAHGAAPPPSPTQRRGRLLATRAGRLPQPPSGGALSWRPAARRNLGTPGRAGSDEVTIIRDTKRVRVVLKRPLGLVLAEEDGGGAYIEGLVARGAALKSGKLEEGDLLVACGPEGGRLIDVERSSFDEVMDTLGGWPGEPKLVLEFEREVMYEEESAASSYWEKKREQKAEARVDRTTPGLVASEVSVGRGSVLGAGSFGTAFRGEWQGRAVVLKRANERVAGAEELLDVEKRLNERAAAAAPGAVAEYLGCLDVAKGEEGRLYNGGLSEGMWLMFAFEGSETLDTYLQKDNLGGLGTTLSSGGGGKGGGVFGGLFGGGAAKRGGGEGAAPAGEAEAARAVMRQLLEGLGSLHKAGVVHRDVKPSNMVVTQRGSIKLIDLGAAAECLGEALCYATGEGPCDPDFCAVDDLYLLPSDAPDPAAGNLEALWDEYRPDRFDVYAAGVVMMQMGVKGLRKRGALPKFQKQLWGCGLDLALWYEEHGAAVLGPGGSEVLDSPGGWELAAALLAPRAERPSAAQALKSAYFK